MKKKILIAVGAFLAAVAILVGIFIIFREKPVEGSKEITIEVINSKEKSTVYELKTDAEYLRQAMDEAKGLTYDGEESQYGFAVYTVNGETADFSVDQSYWAFYVNGEYCNYGIDTQPVEDGDEFQIIYTAE
jgi:hypothetical protein